MPSTLTVRDATNDDMAVVQSIYSHYVLQGLATFEEIAPSVDEMVARRDAIVARDLPYLVAVLDGSVVGYGYAGTYRPRVAYQYTVEDSVYVTQGLVGRGIGKALLNPLIQHCERGPWRQMVAIIGDSANIASVVLHERAGFRLIGTLNAVGFKLGRWVDTVLMQRALGVGSSLPPTR
jgi:L-amino acid N-acyltransferase YncA